MPPPSTKKREDILRKVRRLGATGLGDTLSSTLVHVHLTGSDIKENEKKIEGYKDALAAVRHVFFSSGPWHDKATFEKMVEFNPPCVLIIACHGMPAPGKGDSELFVEPYGTTPDGECNLLVTTERERVLDMFLAKFKSPICVFFDGCDTGHGTLQKAAPCPVYGTASRPNPDNFTGAKTAVAMVVAEVFPDTIGSQNVRMRKLNGEELE